MTEPVFPRGLFKGAVVIYHYKDGFVSKCPLTEDPRKFLTEGDFYLVDAFEMLDGQVNIRVKNYGLFRRMTKKARELRIPFFPFEHFKLFTQN